MGLRDTSLSVILVVGMMVGISGCISDNTPKNTLTNVPIEPTTSLIELNEFEKLNCSYLVNDFKHLTPYRRDCYRIRAYNNLNASLCEEDDFLCKVLIGNNTSYCNQTGDIDACYVSFEGNLSKCLNSLPYDSFIGRCVSYFAILTRSYSVCTVVPSSLFRNECYGDVTLFTGDLDACQKRDSAFCVDAFSRLSVIFQDPSICEKGDPTASWQDYSKKIDEKRVCYEWVYSGAPIEIITPEFCSKIPEKDIKEGCKRVATYWKSKLGFNDKYCEKDTDCFAWEFDCIPGCWNKDRKQYVNKSSELGGCALLNYRPWPENCSCKNNQCVAHYRKEDQKYIDQL